MRPVMRVAAGERAVCEISQQKYYYRQRRWRRQKDPFPPTTGRHSIAVPFQLYA